MRVLPAPRTATASRRGQSASAFDDMMRRVRPGLDVVGSAVLAADLDLVMRYANPVALRTLEIIDAEIEATFGVSVRQMMSGSIHRFHHDPARIERILANRDGFTFPHHAEFTFGTVTLTTHVHELADEGRDRVGYLVTFADVSDLKRAESRSTELKDRLGMAATAVDQLKESITEIGSNADEASFLAHQAENQTGQISDDVARLDEQRAGIDQSLASILAVASQTKLLALNATIEAARAGESGRGFAVVAGEVKDLASKTADVTTEIDSRLNLITASIARLRQDLDAVGNQMAEINAHQAGIAAAVEQQRATASDLADGIARAADTT